MSAFGVILIALFGKCGPEINIYIYNNLGTEIYGKWQVDLRIWPAVGEYGTRKTLYSRSLWKYQRSILEVSKVKPILTKGM